MENPKGDRAQSTRSGMQVAAVTVPNLTCVPADYQGDMYKVEE